MNENNQPKGIERAFNLVLLIVIIVAFLLHILFDIYLDLKEADHRETMIRRLNEELKIRAEEAAQKAVTRTNETKNLVIENSNRLGDMIIDKIEQVYKNERALQRKDMRELMEFISNLPVAPPLKSYPSIIQSNTYGERKEPD